MANTSCLLFTFDEAYLRPGMVAVTTALRNSPRDVPVFVAVDRPSSEFGKTVEDLGQGRTNVLDVGDELEEISEITEGSHLSQIVWARVLVQRLLPDSIERVVYIDGDTLIRQPLDELFSIDLRGRVLGACVDPIATHAQRGDEFWPIVGSSPSVAYFNSGMLVMDLVRWRERECELRVLRIAHGAGRLRYSDQDALNLALWDDWYPLPGHLWNFHARDDLAGSSHAVIAHFSGAKPWQKRIRNALFQKEYQEAARRNGWVIKLPWKSRFELSLRKLIPAGLLDHLQYREKRRYPGLSDLA